LTRPVGAGGTLARIAAVAVAYFVLGRFGLLFASTATGVSAVWPAAGIALGAVLAWGSRAAAGIFLGSLAVTLTTEITAESTRMEAVAVALALATGATGQALLASHLLTRLRCRPRDFASSREVAGLLILGGPVACLLSASIGVTALELAGHLPAGVLLQAWSSWWVGDSLGVVALTPVTLLAGRTGEQWQGRKWSIVLPCLATYALVIGFFALTLRMVHEKRSLRFDRQAGDLAEAVRDQLVAHFEILRGISSLWASSEDVTREEFRTFVSPALARHGGLSAVSWNPRVSASEREALTLAARRGGLTGFEIRERAPDGGLRPAEPRDEHVPVLYIEPFGEHEAALGFDVASESVRAAALRRARDSGDFSATEPLDLVQDDDAELDMLVFLAVYARGEPSETIAERRAAVRGYAVGVYHIADVVETALHGVGTDLQLRLVDEDPEGGARVAWSGGAGSSERLSQSMRRSKRIAVAGRTWRLDCVATTAHELGTSSLAPATALAAGLLVCGMLAAFLLRLAGSAIALRAEMQAREHAQRSLRQRDDELRQALRLEALGRLAGGIAHDFNNLLTAIMGHLGLLESALQAQPEARVDLEEAQKSCERGAALASRLLLFGRRQETDRDVVDVNQVARDIERLLRRTMGSDVALVMQLAAEPCLVAMDRTQLEQVLTNLALNGRDAMPEGGELAFRTERVVLPDAERSPTGPCVLLTVRDSGTGIPSEALPHVFEPYFTTKGVAKGTGLGLSIVHGVVTEGGGRIDVESSPARGTTFRILLPRVAGPAPGAGPDEGATALVPAPEAEDPGGGERILLAEDEPELRKLCAGVLRAKGYEVRTASGGREALALAEREGAPFDLLVTDVQMPDLNGALLAERLRERQPGLRVLFVSGNARGVIKEDAARLPPGTSFLAKPFSPRAFTLRVRDCLDGPPREG
jgi:signal transduction histidine kinase/CheY-like chemotaxis protein